MINVIWLLIGLILGLAWNEFLAWAIKTPSPEPDEYEIRKKHEDFPEIH